MANFKSRDQAKLKAVLDKADEEGRTAEVLKVIQDSFDDKDVDKQGMSDGSKRLRSEPKFAEWGVVEAPMTAGSMAAGSNQAPAERFRQEVLLQGRGPGELPPGIRSVEHRASTICELPKVKAKEATYIELVRESFTNPEMRSYLEKFIMKHNGPSPKVKDLRKFLERINYPNVGPNAPVYYPDGAGAARRFREG